MPHVMVSYDGTRNDRDALFLGRLFAHAGATLSLAYVRHATDHDPGHEASLQQDAEQLLAAGAGLLDGVNIQQRVIFNPSTADGLVTLAAELDADIIAFGSSYRTPQGHVALPHTAEQLLDAEVSCSLAVAPAGFRREPVERSIGTVSVYDEGNDEVARATAKSLAVALGAAVTEGDADFLVVTSRADSPPGKLLLTSAARGHLDQSQCPVLALARGESLSFA